MAAPAVPIRLREERHPAVAQAVEALEQRLRAHHVRCIEFRCTSSLATKLIDRFLWGLLPCVNRATPEQFFNEKKL